ncbi:GntR family transcriptional regulator [Clostridium cylindrosporum]|uniref:Transcriptional regulator, GntR family n=1 Tax=Clostridium cylindrosporum DSM 605 TaxID=1121307 RepID=A0A0J8G3T2_CLOCY|nr:GntR family transcriptional regulator [Clostridium cylindrosporum]KMT22371.1 transcriptional regulator, GntR family [Clostridium cylindrosporum DSM 605]
MHEHRLKRTALADEAKICIQRYINTLNLNESNKLPREEVLAEIIGVSRVTIRSALNELASEGIVIRKQGKGTFVNTEGLEIKVKFNPVLQLRDMISDSGYSPSVKLLGIETIYCDSKLADILNITVGDPVTVAKKMFLADDRPCALCIDYFDRRVISEKDYQDSPNYKNSIFEYIYDKSGKQVTWDKVEITTETNLQNPELEKYIDFKKGEVKAFLLLKGVNFDGNDQPLVYANEYIDTDIIKFNMIRQRKINY